MAGPDILAVARFWEENPLFFGESRYDPGTKEFFEEHRRVVLDDCLAGKLDPRTIPPKKNRDVVLDLGCGPGFWSVELQLACSIGRMVSADLTNRAVELTRRRLALYGLAGAVRQEDAERLSFADGTFGHVNCQGVIHHTPHTEKALLEIARVLRPGGTASISVYYRNIILRNFPRFRWLARLLWSAGAKLKGRGRENMFVSQDADEIVRTYDGSGNPIGKSYSREAFIRLLEKHFVVEDIYFHFFPARSLPFRLPKTLHHWLDRRLPFMIYATVRKD